MTKGVFGYLLLLILAIGILMVQFIRWNIFWLTVTFVILQILILLIIVLKGDDSRRGPSYYGEESSNQEKEIGGGLHESRL